MMGKVIQLHSRKHTEAFDPRKDQLVRLQNNPGLCVCTAHSLKMLDESSQLANKIQGLAWVNLNA